MMNAIYTENLMKNYGKARGIREVSLQVETGEFFGFIGPNGAGKSTTIRILLGLLNASAGEAKIFGMDCRREREKTLEYIGYLPAEASFYPGMKVKEVLRLSADLRGKNCGEEAAVLCERLKLDTEKKTEELSFGNRKKVGIVCALQHRPDLLILDEPTSGLDPLMQKEFFSILKERNEEGTTVFLSSHILSEVQNYCHRAALIKDGRIITCDRVENLMKTSVKRVNVVGAGFDFRNLQGVKDLSCQADETTFLYNGEASELLAALAQGKITDFSVREPDLEEVFLHYYEED